MRLILTFTFGFLALMLLQAQQQFDNYKAPLKIAQKSTKERQLYYCSRTLCHCNESNRRR